ncbi:MAG: class I mannose-6-phosphate isomerase [Planctomycetota bacterium]
MSRLVPRILQRRLLPKPWGGRSLERVLGIALPAGERIGESWELWDRPEGSSSLLGTEQTLKGWMESGRDDLLGRARPGHGGRFPLLLKYIDAAEALSVQVHPGDAAAREEGDGGKEEAWVVLAAGPRARIVLGCREGVAKEQLREALARGAVEDLLHSFRPEPGQCIHVPPGTLHAIGPDVVLFEVQQNSDLTYRLHDWGRDRELHVEKALAALAESRGAVRGPSGGRGDSETLLQTESFRIRRFGVSDRATVRTEGAFLTVNVLSGRGIMGWRSKGADRPLPLSGGDCVLVPACAEEVFLSAIGGLEVLVCDPGER